MTITSAVDYDDVTEHNPFPGPDRPGWTQTFSETLAAETGMPLEITDAIAPYVVRPKTYLTRSEGTYRFRPGVITEDPSTKLRVLSVTVHGFTGTPGEYNERIRGTFHSPARPNPDPARMLPRLVTGTDTEGKPLPYLTTLQSVTANTLSSLIGVMEDALSNTDGARGYKLRDDIRTYGQNETTLHAPLLRVIDESDNTGAAGRRVLDLTAIKGANRTRARLALFGLSTKEIVFGIDRRKLVLPEPRPGVEYPARIADPTVWVPAFATAMHKAFGDPRHPQHEVAHDAAKVATVPLQIIVGTADPHEFHNVVFDPNRADHRRPPLGYILTEKAASDLRAVLRDAKANGWITESERAWLAGEGDDPNSQPGEDTVFRRDRRDRALFAAVFPSDKSRADAVRRVLGEPSRSYTNKDHVANRLRMVSAVAGEGYRHRWNPRVLDGLLSSTFLKGYEGLANLPEWSSALTAARTDPDVLERFLTTRGIHWLAENKIIDADRGSIGAQAGTHETDSEQQGETTADRQIRRSTINARKAMLLQTPRTIALMQELAAAANENRAPRAIDTDNNPVGGSVATKHWFDTQFPKTVQRRTKTNNRDSQTDPTAPKAPDPTPQELLTLARAHFYTVVTDTMPAAIVDLITSARELLDAARNAQQPALHGATDDEVVAISKALSVTKTDLQMLAAMVADMRFGHPRPEESQTEKFLTDEVGEEG
ncbi:hypothetical protein ACFVZE_23440 [Streptomyces anulatus]|uniref:hypothetical protein n=1 Tax=Streptomyces anulatus TaxID=1892 RepID=UPI0036DD3B41